MIVRQINENDLNGLLNLAKKAGTGITTLQNDKALLQKDLSIHFTRSAKSLIILKVKVICL